MYMRHFVPFKCEIRHKTIKTVADWRLLVVCHTKPNTVVFSFAFMTLDHSGGYGCIVFQCMHTAEIIFIASFSCTFMLFQA